MATARTGPHNILKRLLVGRALATHKQEHQLLPKTLALPVFASDQLSSVAYATEQMMLMLVVAGAVALPLMMPLGIGIAVLLAVVIVSYRQTCRAYPRGGGSYIVARENLGTIPGLTAAAAIQTSYVLTVSVSATAGAIAITSVSPALGPYKVTMALAFVGLITVANLRGARESGRLFALPTYGFVTVVFATLGWGLVRCASGCPRAETEALAMEPVAGLALFLVLRAFASGATALTGVEAIADGVQAFRRPQSRNAAATLAIMGSFSIPMFLGITLLAHLLGVRVNEEIALTRSVLAQIGETVFGRSAMFFALQTFTALILVLAANTAYQDFPRLSSILARDRFMPSQFRNRGDRLVFSNGILTLSVLAGILIWVFDGELTRLLHLYVVGVFVALTLSQAGMVRRWLRHRGPRWRLKMATNALGATLTGLVLAITAVTKFLLGAWIVIAAVPVIIGVFLAVHRHYGTVGRALGVRELSPSLEPPNVFVVLVSDLGPAATSAVAYLRAIRPRDVYPLFVGEASSYEDAALGWNEVAPRLGKLEWLADGDAHPVRALRRYVRSVAHGEDGFVTVVIPETVLEPWWWQVLRRRSAFWVKASLLFERGIVVTDIPLLPPEVAEAVEQIEHPLEPTRNVVLVPVSGVHDATVRAVVYAKALRPARVEALFFAGDPEEVAPIVEEWSSRRMDIPLSVVEAPFRDIGPPLLEEIRKATGRGDTIVTVVLPEFVVHRWWGHLLHNQTGLYIKRLLIVEPRVVVTSVPFHIKRDAAS